MLAQLVELLAFNQDVAGSNPARPTKHGILAQLEELLPLKEDVVGSSPTGPTN